MSRKFFILLYASLIFFASTACTLAHHAFEQANQSLTEPDPSPTVRAGEPVSLGETRPRDQPLTATPEPTDSSLIANLVGWLDRAQATPTATPQRQTLRFDLPTFTPTATPTETPSPTPTATSTFTPSATPTETATPLPTNTLAPTNTPVPTNTPLPTNTPRPRPPTATPAASTFNSPLPARPPTTICWPNFLIARPPTASSRSMSRLLIPMKSRLAG